MTRVRFIMLEFMLVGLCVTRLAIAQVDIDYFCPSNCLCATIDQFTLDKVQLRCEIPTVTGINFEIIQARYTTNLYLVCAPLFGGQLADGAFQHLNELEELSFEHCPLGAVTADTFRGLTALKTLNITLSNAAEFHPNAFLNTPHLEVINFNQQKIQSLPEGLFCGLQKLRHLDLSQNQLRSQNDLGISNENSDCAFPELDWLNVMDNNIGGAFTLQLSNITPSLQVFTAHKNEITELSEHSFQNLAELKFLDISGNHIEFIAPNSFQGLYSLEILYISENRIQCLAKDVFQDTPQLKLFVAKYNHIRQTCMDYDVFHNIPSLQYLDLHKNYFIEINSSLFQNLTNLKEMFLGHNHIRVIQPVSFDNLQELLVLNLTHNQLRECLLDTANQTELFPLLHSLDLSHNTLRDSSINVGLLPSLQTLFLHNNYLQTIPHQFKTSRVLSGIDLSVNNISHIHTSDFFGYDKVKTLILRGNKVKYIPRMCFEHMLELEGLDLSYNDINTLEIQAFSLPPKLKELDLSHNEIAEIDLVFDKMPSLEMLYLTGNSITAIRKGVFPSTLVDIDLSSNEISFIESNTFDNAPRLQSVRLETNRLRTIQKNVFRVSPQVLSKPKFYIGINPYECDCNMEYLWTHNEGQDLAHPPLSIIYGDIADLNSIFCRIFNRFGKQSIYFRSVEHFFCTFNQICSYETNSCECCNDESVNSCPCREQCPDECICFKTLDLNYIETVCSQKNLTSIPDVLHKADVVYLDGNYIRTVTYGAFENNSFMTSLFLNSSSIKTIEAGAFIGLKKLKELYLHDNDLNDLSSGAFQDLVALTHLKLRNNKLSKFTGNIMQKMPHLKFLDLRNNNFQTIDMDIFGGENITKVEMLYLSNNNWSCDCLFGPNFQHWLTANIFIVKDAENITCGMTDMKVTLNDTSSVLAVDFSSCKPIRSEVVLKMSKTLAILTAAMAFVFVITFALTIFIFKKRELLQVWLYSRFGFRLFKSKEDSERQFDAFISYSQSDQAVVVQELLPRLEEGDPPYALCVHFRDWLIGRGIAESVVESVNASKRTILLLSNSFIESEWCNYEFKTAHHRLLQDKSCHLIVILLDEEPPKDLDKELQMYIKTHTYIRYSDPWFWKRLKYALPDVTEEQKVQRYEKKRQEKEAIEEQRRFLEKRGHRITKQTDIEMSLIC